MFGFGPAGQVTNNGLVDFRTWVRAGSALSATFQYVIYAGTQTFSTKPTDQLANQIFRGTLSSYNFKRSIIGGFIGGMATGDGQLVIDNGDAFYDFLPNQYSISGRMIDLKLGRSTDSYDDYFPVNKITASDWNVDESNVNITIRDFGYRLAVPVQPNLYAGSGGIDGGSDLAGKRIPRCWGECLNIAPPLLVPASLIYQVNDGSVEDVVAVYDRGVSLTKGSDYADYAALVAAAVTAGQYGTCLALGLFKLGSTPAGTVTADIHGSNGDGYLETTADICRDVLETVLSAAEIDTTSFDAVNSLQPATIGYYIGENETPTVADVCANIMTGVGGWLGFTRLGLAYVSIFVAPTGTAADSFTRTDIFGEAKREPLSGNLTPAVWRWRVSYQRVWQQQTDLATSVSADRKAFVGTQYRLAEASTVSIQTDYPTAKDQEPVQSYFANEADAQDEADRLLALYRTTRRFYRLTLPRRILLREIGDIISITYPRWDLSSGRLMTILEISESVDFDGDNVEVVCYG